MDSPGLPSPLTCIKGVFIMAYLLGFTRCSETDASCTCTDIKPRPQTQPPTPGCFQLSATYRYKCIDGYVRKAGTSNLIRCMGQEKWSEPSLECIVNPLNPPQPTTAKPTSTRATLETSALPQKSSTFSTSPRTTSSDFFSSVSSGTKRLATTSTVTTPQHFPAFSTSPRTTSSDFFSSVSSGTKRLGTTSTVTTPQHFPDSPSTPPASPSAPVTPERSYATSALSSPTTTIRLRFLETTTSSSSSSSQQEAHAVATEVIAPVAVVIIVLAAAGAIWLLYRRKSRKRPKRNHSEIQTAAEESIPINNMT